MIKSILELQQILEIKQIFYNYLFIVYPHTPIFKNFLFLYVEN